MPDDLQHEVIEKRPAAYLEEWLRQSRRQRSETTALTSNKKDCLGQQFGQKLRAGLG
jgi:hypothetical protein